MLSGCTWRTHGEGSPGGWSGDKKAESAGCSFAKIFFSFQGSKSELCDEQDINMMGISAALGTEEDGRPSHARGPLVPDGNTGGFKPALLRTL